ncbi:P-loop NTPase family protein [Falsiroseomonas tokyonensis]|uniref:Uncharacterized protein n=1 Tax=Falsiroseomonas tokyonensis TaxID=430521 RepID=A0ABV7BMC8_9PROT|nr:hypothetical protein [Falsiroseomonas tokyonensis]MBU8536720.1 hypothetical protein [Falsiroseomonas tokyonensis]
MTGMTAPRSHLAERAVAAMGPLRATETLAAEALAPQEPVLREVLRNAESFTAPPAAPPPAIGLEALREAGLAFEPQAEIRPRLVEELTLIQHQVLRAIPPIDPMRPALGARQAVMVTSARPEEGKSFIALNLAASLAAAGERPVLLVDVDGTSGALTERLGLAQAPGLRALAQDPSQPVSLLLRTAAIAGLSVLPYGARLPGQAAPSGAALATAVRTLAAALPRHVLVLDTPAALASSDAPALAAMVGQVLLVVQAEATPRDAVEAALDVLEACPVLQLMLNRSRVASDDSFGDPAATADG